MNQYKKWQYKLLGADMVKILRSKHYDAYYADDTDEARKLIVSMIPEGSLIGLGGSVTIAELDLLSVLRNGKYRLIDRYQKMSRDDEVKKYREALHADYFVSGVNAVTRNGELVNVDSSGNRVSAMIFGPEKVIMVAGVNKIVNNIDEAFQRLRKIAPMNVHRLGHNTPCALTGICEDCSSSERMCNYTTIIHHGMKFKNRLIMIIVADDLGF